MFLHRRSIDRRANAASTSRRGRACARISVDWPQSLDFRLTCWRVDYPWSSSVQARCVCTSPRYHRRSLFVCALRMTPSRSPLVSGKTCRRFPWRSWLGTRLCSSVRPQLRTVAHRTADHSTCGHVDRISSRATDVDTELAATVFVEYRRPVTTRLTATSRRIPRVRYSSSTPGCR